MDMVTPCYRVLAGLLLTALGTFGCGLAGERPLSVDLLEQLRDAERLSAAPGDRAIGADVIRVGADARTALILTAPARVTWTVRLPLHAHLRSAVTGAGTLRIGVSDGRIYDELLRTVADDTWQPIDVNLREYSEVKWSLFYQPLRRDWRIIINADAPASGGDARLALDRPLIASYQIFTRLSGGR